MDKYIALKPGRFDRDYRAGETIPDGVIDPRSVKRLMDAGRIAKAEEQTVTYLGGEERRVSTLNPEDMRNAFLNGEVVEAMSIDALLECESREERVATAEALLSIEPADGLDLNARAAACVEQLAAVLSEAGAPSEDESKDEDPPGDDPPAAPTPEPKPEDDAKPEFKCEVCGKVCSTKASLANHMKTHD